MSGQAKMPDLNSPSNGRRLFAHPMTIGALELPGVAKMAEEAGEIGQVVGKLLATGGDAEHWDGTNLHARLVEEAGDMLAAIRYFGWANDVTTNIEERAAVKRALFQRWHDEAEAAEELGASGSAA